MSKEAKKKCFAKTQRRSSWSEIRMKNHCGTAACGTMLTNVVVFVDGKEVTNVVLTFADIKELVIGWKKK